MGSSKQRLVPPNVNIFFTIIRTKTFYFVLYFINIFSALHIKLGDNDEVPVDLNYFRETRLQVLETEMEGDLNSAEIVSFRYDNFDILCLEMLILEDENNELHIIQVIRKV